MDPQQNNRTSRFRKLLPSNFNGKIWLSIVISLAIGVLAGYFYADRNSDNLSQRLEAAEQGSVFAKERVYVNDLLDFSLILPTSWVKKVVISNQGSSTGFYFKDMGTGDKSSAVLVFTIYKCSVSDFQSLKGITTDVTKCPGSFLDSDEKSAYTWQPVSQKRTLDSALKDSDNIIKEFGFEVAPSFRIVK